MKFDRTLVDALEWRAEAKRLLDEAQWDGWALISPIHDECGKPHLEICLRAQVMEFVKFLDEWMLQFGEDYTIDISTPQMPYRYAVVWDHPDYPEGRIIFPRGQAPSAGDEALKPNRTVH
jgi:hypothetical protein